MQIRKLFLATLALAVLAGAPAWAEEGSANGPEGQRKMMKGPDADTDGDGFLSKAEFLAVQEQRFAEMDGDSDGKISKDEMKNHFEKVKHKLQERRKEHEEKMKAKEEKKGK